MEPILLIHGYGSEQGKDINRRGAQSIYGSLPRWLRSAFPDNPVEEIDLGRYISLEDGIGIDDISRALDMALRDKFGNRLRKPFHVVIHSTGALVVRNWVRKFAPDLQPIRNLVYLAGANFGSGWAHIGSNRLARWGREIFTGSEAGVRVLRALELGSSETIDLHLALLEPGETMVDRRIREFGIIGSQPSTRWFERPIRQAKEDGSDGVVRVSGSNLNFHYARFEANDRGKGLSTRDVLRLRGRDRLPDDAVFYEQAHKSVPGEDGREEIPFAIPYNTAHSGDDYSVVYGSRTREYVEPLLRRALETRTIGQWRTAREPFDAATRRSRVLSQDRPITGRFSDWKRQHQYDGYSQVMIRLFDEDDRPIEDYDIFFDSKPADGSDVRVADLIEDKHRNGATPNVLAFYLNVDKWQEKGEEGTEAGWHDRRLKLESLTLEISANEPQTDDIQYVPFKLEMGRDLMERWIVPNRTTILDIRMRRVPSPDVFRIFKY